MFGYVGEMLGDFHMFDQLIHSLKALSTLQTGEDLFGFAHALQLGALLLFHILPPEILHRQTSGAVGRRVGGRERGGTHGDRRQRTRGARAAHFGDERGELVEQIASGRRRPVTFVVIVIVIVSAISIF